MQKFLLAYNPHNPSGLFIVHCLDPLVLIEVDKQPGDRWELSVVSNAPADPDRIFKVLKRARYWFKEYRLKTNKDG